MSDWTQPGKRTRLASLVFCWFNAAVERNWGLETRSSFCSEGKILLRTCTERIDSSLGHGLPKFNPERALWIRIVQVAMKVSAADNKKKEMLYLRIHHVKPSPAELILLGVRIATIMFRNLKS
jgi:hypothetical protein